MNGRRTSAAANVLIVVAGWGSAARAGSLEARYELIVVPPQQAVEVRMTLRGDFGDGPVRLALPQGFAFVRLPEPLLDGKVMARAGNRPAEMKRIDPFTWELQPDGANEAAVSYRVPLRHRELEAVKPRDAYEYPYLADDHGLLVTATLLMHSATHPIGPIRVVVQAPAGWGVIAPWPKVGASEFAPADTSSATNDLIAIGAWQVKEVQVGDFAADLAVAPGQAALFEKLADPIELIVERELKLFGRPARGRYLFVFGRPDMPGMGGSPKSNSMTLTVEPRLVAAAAPHLAHLIAHEFFHTWAGQRVEVRDELRWLNEGITDYYAYLVSAQTELISWPKFASELSDKMRAAAASPLREKVSLVEAGGPRFFSDREAYDLTYAGGLLLGAWLDQAIRRHSPDHTLEDLMRGLLNDPRRSSGAAEAASRAPGPTLNDLLTLVTQYAGRQRADQLRNWVTAPYAFDPVTAFAQVGVEVTRESQPASLDLRANFNQTRVGPIDPADAAYLLGLRTGDEVLRVNGQDVADERAIRSAWRSLLNGKLELRIRREGKEQTLAGPVPTVERYEISEAAWK